MITDVGDVAFRLAGRSEPSEFETETGVFSVPQPVDDEDGCTNLRFMCVAGDDLGRTFPVPRGPSVIGRGDVGIALLGSDVSRNHARVVFAEGTCIITDTSRNGTFVNGVRIHAQEPQHLLPGDRVQVGATILVFERTDAVADRLHQLEKLAAMGTLLAGVAHDFKNMLMVILFGIDELEVSARPEHLPVLADIRNAAMSGTTLVKQLSQLDSHRSQTPFSAVDVASVVRETLAMAAHVLDARIHVSSTIADGVTLHASREEIRQALLNLIINAGDAMPDGGNLQITVEHAPLDRAAANALQLRISSGYVRLVVQDTGVGMDEETRARVFEPFFTTKAQGKGTGLGLAVVHSTVRRHGGAISVASAPGEGTCFEIYLPTAA